MVGAAAVTLLLLGGWFLLTLSTHRIANPIRILVDNAQVALGLDVSQGERAK